MSLVPLHAQTLNTFLSSDISGAFTIFKSLTISSTETKTSWSQHWQILLLWCSIMMSKRSGTRSLIALNVSSSWISWSIESFVIESKRKPQVIRLECLILRNLTSQKLFLVKHRSLNHRFNNFSFLMRLLIVLQIPILLHAITSSSQDLLNKHRFFFLKVLYFMCISMNLPAFSIILLSLHF